MKNALLAIVLSVSSTFFLTSTDLCLAQDERAAILNPQETGEDFKFQGEYVGEVEKDGGKQKVGLQVIAQGKGQFLGVGYFGGLPGGGMIPGLPPMKGDAKVEGKTLQFTGDAEVTITGDTGEIRDSARNLVGSCKKFLRKSPTLGMKPPQGAIVLFDGSSTNQFKDGKLDGDLLQQGCTSTKNFQDFRLHLEFMLSYMPEARGQQRSNSGCYCQGRYEVQILDSFGLSGEDNECGAIYGVKKPEVNACYPPLTWQTYDIQFTAAKFEPNGNKTKNARINVIHNGVVVQNDVEIPMSTRAAPVKEGPEPGPIYLQDHKNPVRFRNVWIVESK